MTQIPDHFWDFMEDGDFDKFVKNERKDHVGDATDMVAFQEMERRIVDYFKAAGCDVEQNGLEWFLSLYDEGPAISLTALTLALTSKGSE